MTENQSPGDTGDTGASTHTHDGPRVSGEEMRDLAGMRRSTTDKHLAGVSGGVARHLDIDPVIIRVAFVVLAFFGGAGIILYAAGWLLLPQDDGSRAPFDLDSRSRSVALIGVGVLAALALVGDAWGPGWFPWPLVVVGLIAWLILARRDRRAEQPAGPPGVVAPGQASRATFPSAPLQPRSPRKRGPILFWYTLALIAIGTGLLGIFDLAGFDVVGSAYPALALGIIAVMLLVGAFFGRAGGLILLGLIAALGLTIGTIADQFDGAQIDETPTLATEVESTYEFEAGEATVDLTEVRDLENLDGRDIRVDGDLGRIEVIVPEDLTVDVDARMEGGGDVSLFGERDGRSWDYTMSARNNGPANAPQIDLDLDMGFGEIVVVTR